MLPRAELRRLWAAGMRREDPSTDRGYWFDYSDLLTDDELATDIAERFEDKE